MYTHQVQVANGGSVGLPYQVCQDLGIKEGDVLQLVVIDGEIHLQSRQKQIKKAQQLFKHHFVQSGSLVDELIQDRKVEAANE